MPQADASDVHPRPAPVKAVRRKVETAPLRRVALWCAIAAATLHTLAVAWTWLSAAPGVGSFWLVWLDLPISLAYLHVMGDRLVLWSLFAGGLQWAASGALLAVIVGWSARRR